MTTLSQHWHDDNCFYYFKRSSLVPSIEGLCSSKFEFGHGFTFSSFQKYVKEKKQLVQDLIPPPSIYIYTGMCTCTWYTNMYMPKFSPSGFFGPSRCL